ncbi:hypothetical protein B4U80_12802 [Leptotrombidium deliense]|uniref:Alpha/beta hydrolase fold-3 domain-containing protein n=1 Tax=Leptotrombidium deliense TaxID=299467 RepID=A0A443SLE6_9ACAR|nr:hypothetical protein B4U80_12802 [Leptotrombidium deliense]
MCKRRPKLKQYLYVSRCLRIMFEILLNFKQDIDKENANESKRLLASNYEVGFQGFTYTQKYIKELSVIFGCIGPFWLHHSFQKIFRRLTIGVALFQTTFPKSLVVCRNKKSRGMKYAKASVSGKILRLLNVGDSKFHSFYVNFQYRRSCVKSVAKIVDVENLFQICVEKPFVKVNEYKRKKQLRFRYIFNRYKIDDRKDILLHVHGGCFIKSSPDAHEIYLRDWTQKLSNVPIVALDYSKSKFPAGLQDVLDFYLWLTTSDQVESVLGYKPEKVIVSGDSAGANLAVALCLILTDITKLKSSVSINFPAGIVGVYGVFKVLPVMSPSRLLSGIDPVLYQTVNLSGLYYYSGINEEQKIEELKNNKKQWFQKTDDEVKEIFNKVTNILEHPYATPLYYNFFDDVPKIPLSLISCQFCPLLDDSIELANTWKGPVNLQVLNSLPHGFLNFTLISNEAMIASDKCVNQVEQLLNLDHNL